MPHEVNGQKGGFIEGLNALANIADLAVIGFSPNRKAAGERREIRADRATAAAKTKQESIQAQIEASAGRIKNFRELVEKDSRFADSQKFQGLVKMEAATLAHLRGHGVSAAQISGAVMAPGLVEPRPDDPFESVNSAAQLAINMLDADLEPDTIAAALQAARSSAEGDPQTIAGIDAIINSLPASIAEHKRALSQAEIIAAQPRIDALIEAGVSPENAALAVYGRATVQLQGGLAPAVQSKLQSEIIELDVIRTDIERVLPKITDAVVGLQGNISGSDIASVLTQLPVTKQIAEAIGGPIGLDPESVQNALKVRADLLFTTRQMSRFILRQTGRISNEQLKFVEDATRLMRVATTKEVATDILLRLDRIAAQRQRTAGELLGGGDLPGAGDAGAVSEEGQVRERIQELLSKANGVVTNLSPEEQTELSGLFEKLQ